MSSVPTPQLPQYRITLFYGPEVMEGHPSRVHCVFNVKKRSWKGGIQVVVEVDEAQLARARQAIRLDDWMKTAMAVLPADERLRAEHRASDLFIQALCTIKLALVAEAGLPQDSTTIRAQAFSAELERVVAGQAQRVTRYVAQELDLVAE